jgi:ABC-type nickel/cobalt efflux system permease component RcnA
MEFSNLYALITLALSLGIVHALDADHIMAVSALTSTNNNSRSSVRFCVRWAIGHGVTLIVIGCCVYLLGMAIPDQLSHYAEHAVGLVLIAIGLYLLYTLHQKRAHVHYHKHDGLPEHAHWHSHHRSQSADTHKEQHNNGVHQHNHSALMVGVLHGAAGSAPLLVLIPLAQLENPVYGVIYLMVFSIAVLACMALFGGMLGFVYQWVSLRGSRVIKLLRITIAFGAIMAGGFLLAGV